MMGKEKYLVVMVTWLSKPMIKSMRKKSTDHSGEMGNMDTASGQATNVSPGPEIENQLFTIQLDPLDSKRKDKSKHI